MQEGERGSRVGVMKDQVLAFIVGSGEKGAASFEVVDGTGLGPENVYPIITMLCREGLILDSQSKRKSPQGRRVTVWVAKEHGGVVPVWRSGSTKYRYSGLAKEIMDALLGGPQTMLSVCHSTRLPDQFGAVSTGTVSSVLSKLKRQGWVRTLPEKKLESYSRKKCFVFELTPLGRRIIEKSPKRSRGDE
jgi:DNA-binding PadR family transcriptional regulator